MDFFKSTQEIMEEKKKKKKTISKSHPKIIRCNLLAGHNTEKSQ